MLLCTHDVGYLLYGGTFQGRLQSLGPGACLSCPVWKLLSWPCLEGPWALYKSVCKTLGRGQPRSHWTHAGCFLRVCSVLGLPLNLITLMMVLIKTCSCGTATSLSYLSLVEIPKQPYQQALPSPLYIRKDSDSEISSLAKGRDRIQIQT